MDHLYYQGHHRGGSAIEVDSNSCNLLNLHRTVLSDLVHQFVDASHPAQIDAEFAYTSSVCMHRNESAHAAKFLDTLMKYGVGVNVL